MTQLIPILLYHSVSERAGDSFAIAPDQFVNHVEAIAATGRTALTMSEIADGIRGLRRLPERCVGITFDDGFGDTVDAVELLSHQGLRSTVYVTTGFVGTANMLSERQLEVLAGGRDSVELGAHTVTHPFLDELTLPAAEHEIRSSKAALEQLIDRPVDSFAYPHGAHGARVRRLVVELGYRSAAAVKNVISHAGDDPWAIARWTVRSTTSVDDVERFLEGWSVPLAGRRERLRTKAYRGVRRVRRKLRSAEVRSLHGSPARIVLDAPNGHHVSTGAPNGHHISTGAPNGHHVSTTAALISVVVPTCADATAALRCVKTIRDQACGPLEVIVVENRPAQSDVNAALTGAFGRDPAVRYVEESTPGLSRARNAGLAAAGGSIVAFVDDDVVVDDCWLDALRDAFAAYPEATCVTGLIEPLELGTRAESLLEQHATFGKGLTRRVYRLDAPPDDVPLFPYTAGHFGSGANMAFRREALLGLGGFDPCLGAGTRTRGAEDLDICIRLILSGQTLVYEPRAIVRHRHLHTMGPLYRKVFSYGIGLGALIAKHLTSGPNRSRLIRLIPAGVQYVASRGSRKNAKKGPDFPRRLDVIEWIGLALGPIAYARSRALVNEQAPALERNAADAAPVRPIWSGELELSSPAIETKLPLTRSGVAFDEARLLIRVLGEPLGFVRTPLSSDKLNLQQALDAMDADLGELVEHRLAVNGLPTFAELIAGRQGGATRPAAWIADSDRALVTVIVCTHNRAQSLVRCLQSLQRLRYRNLELLIIDNAPADDSTMELVCEIAREDARVRYVREDRPGLSAARNRGLREARGELIAYTDDDVRVDPLWVDGVVRGFRRRADIGCVTGLVASASLERPAEQYFDARVGWSSSCEQRLFDASARPDDSRLHPFAAGAFGTGANVAFRREAIEAIGGFDESLGAGSPTCGGEDLDAFVRLLRSGRALSYEPAALVWHDHRVDQADLQRQMYCYGKGLSAYLCKFLFARSSGREVTGRLLAGALHAGRMTQRSQAAANRSGVAPGLLGAEMRGWLAGPWAYFRARSQQHRAHVRAVAP
jgi:GT2 family glycosyltransferase/peptidoglycan/xylan/chitin deacetylase (PgdA/CDA1 family)